MANDPRFGPTAQTPEQRAYVLAQMQVTNPLLKMRGNAQAQQLFARYIAGDLSWAQVRQELDAAHP